MKTLYRNWRRLLVSMCIILIALFLSGCAMEDRAWDKAVEEHSSESYSKYLEKYPDGLYEEQARDELTWEETVKSDDIRKYEEYLQKRPDGKYAHKAAWQVVLGENSYQDYLNYINKYPDSDHLEQARERCLNLLFLSSKQNRTSSEVDAYYKEMASLVPNAIIDDVLLLSNRWSEVNGPSWETGYFTLDPPLEVQQAAESVWRFSEQNYGARLGVYLASQKIRLVVNQNFDRGYEGDLPLYERASLFLTLAGLTVVSEDATIYDATLEIDLKGSPRGANYDDGRWHWSGASGNGKITFLAADKKMQWDFSNSTSVPQRITRDYYSPSDAPMFDIMPTYEAVLFKALGAILGPDFFIAMLEKEPITLDRTGISFDDRRIVLLIKSFEAQDIIGWENDRGEAGAWFWIFEEEWDEVVAIGSPAILPLIRCLTNTGFSLNSKHAAEEALIKINDDRAIEPLLPLLFSGPGTVRMKAVNILGEIGDQRALRPLEILRYDRDIGNDLWTNILEAMKKIRSRSGL